MHDCRYTEESNACLSWLNVAVKHLKEDHNYGVDSTTTVAFELGTMMIGLATAPGTRRTGCNWRCKL